jgi:hypothetical protein
MSHESYIDTQTTNQVKSFKDAGYSDERILQEFLEVKASAKILLQVAKAIFLGKLDS